MQTQTLKNHILQFLFLFSIALALHLPGISFHSLWFDETSTAYMVSQHGYANLFESLYTFEGTPPLFFIFEKAFVKVFSLPINEFSLRFLPMIFGCIACVLVFFIFIEIGDRRTASLAFGAVVFSNFYVYLFHEARSYSMLTMMALLSLWLVMQWWKKASIPRTIALFASIVLLVQIHYFALFWMAAIGVSVLIIKRKDKQLLGFLGLIIIASCISFGTLLSLFSTQISHETGPVYDDITAKWFSGLFYSPIKVMIGASLPKLFTIRDLTVLDLLSILPTAILIVIAGYLLFMQFVRKTISDAEKLILLCVCIAFIIHAALGSIVPTVHPRYMSYFLILIFGLVLSSVRRSIKMQVLFFCCFIAINCFANVKYYNRSYAYIEPWRDIAEAVDNFAESDGAKNETIIGNFVTCHALAFYLKHKTAELYCVPKLSTPDSYAQLDKAKVNLFGSMCITPLFHYDYHPVIQRSSFIDIIKAQSHGLLLTKKKSGPSVVNQLKTEYKGIIDFTLLRIFKTYQGDVVILSWKYTGGKVGIIN
jgi:uncharacterized membrane protein